MYEYPIYKHLIQFSQLVDKDGKLKEVPTPAAGLLTEEHKDQKNKLGENARNEDQANAEKDDDKEAYEGGEGENDPNLAP